MTRALATNAELTFEMKHELDVDAETNATLDDPEQLVEIRRDNILEEKKKQVVPMKTRLSPRIARKLRFQKDVALEQQDEEEIDTN